LIRENRSEENTGRLKPFSDDLYIGLDKRHSSSRAGRIQSESGQDRIIPYRFICPRNILFYCKTR